MSESGLDRGHILPSPDTDARMQGRGIFAGYSDNHNVLVATQTAEAIKLSQFVIKMKDVLSLSSINFE